MGKRSPIQEYYQCKHGTNLAPCDADVTNKDIYELLERLRIEHRTQYIEQCLLLESIIKQRRNQFGHEVLANIVGSAAWDGILYLGTKIFKP